MDKKVVLVTGIGGNVGQGICRNIRAAGFNIKIVGCNTDCFSAGNHLCDVFYNTPFGYEFGYIDAICRIATRHSVDLVIPSTDYEAFYLAYYADKIPCPVAVSDAETVEKYIDKYMTSQHHRRYGIPFAETVLPSEYDGSFTEHIVKPRKGRGSRNLHFNVRSLRAFTDEEYVIQEIIRGKEITVAFYVDRDRRLHGFITFERDLRDGLTYRCAVITKHDEKIKAILEQIIKSAIIKGSANLQAIVKDTGEIIPFEINCRLSGTNSIRANFGFEDVKYTLQEYLFNKKPEEPENSKGIAVRILLDVIYPGANDYTDLKDNSSKHYIY